MTFVHHAFRNIDPTTDPHVKELIVECTACTWTVTGLTRRPDAKSEGERHENEHNHQSTTNERNLA